MIDVLQLVAVATIITALALVAYAHLLGKLKEAVEVNDSLNSNVTGLRSELDSARKELRQSRKEKMDLRVELEKTRQALIECQAGGPGA